MAMFWSYDVIALHRPVTGHTENMVTTALGFSNSFYKGHGNFRLLDSFDSEIDPS